jgi:hypothetical protein
MVFLLAPGVLLGSRVFLALRWTMPGMFLGDVASHRRLYLAAKPSHVGVNVDGLAYLLHHPTTCSRQTACNTVTSVPSYTFSSEATRKL